VQRDMFETGCLRWQAAIEIPIDCRR
jgi:hypothetical protein